MTRKRTEKQTKKKCPQNPTLEECFNALKLCALMPGGSLKTFFFFWNYILLSSVFLGITLAKSYKKNQVNPNFSLYTILFLKP